MLFEIWNLLKDRWDTSESTRMVEEYNRLEQKHCVINDFYKTHGVHL